MVPEIINPTETDAEWAEGQLNLFRSRFDPILAAFLDLGIADYLVARHY